MEIVSRLDMAKPRLALVATKYLSEEQLCILARKMWGENSALRRCDPDSFMLAIFTACQFGLDPTGVGNQAHIIPYGKEAKFVRGWGGVITMAARKGIKIDTFAVYDGDEFEVIRQSTTDGYFVGIHHKEVRGNEEPGEVKASYAVATCREWDQPMIEVVWRHDIEKIRNLSANSGSPAWKNWYSEMARKTAVNRLAKRLPLFIDVKEQRGDSVSEGFNKVQVPIGSLPSEDAYQPAEEAAEEKESDKMIELIARSLELRKVYSDIYGQIVGKKDITKMGEDELEDYLNKVERIGIEADEASMRDLPASEPNQDELGF